MKYAFICLISLLSARNLLAQPGPGKIEMSLSGSLQSIETRNGDGIDRTSASILVIPRMGFFPIGGLELEPELIFMQGDREDPMYVLNGNVSYNFFNAGRAVPFVLAGYGIANSLPVLNHPTGNYDFTIGVLNVGGGVKVFVADNVALRIEYRFQKFTGEKQVALFDVYGYGSYTSKADTQMHTFQFGFSVFL